jgi:hypothetical protein
MDFDQTLVNIFVVIVKNRCRPTTFASFSQAELTGGVQT